MEAKLLTGPSYGSFDPNAEVLKDKQEQSQSKVNGRRLKPPELFALPSYEPELHPRPGYVGGDSQFYITVFYYSTNRITDKKGPGRPPGSINPFCRWRSWPLISSGQDSKQSQEFIIAQQQTSSPLLPLFTIQLPKQFDSARHGARDPNHVFSLEL
ncbi:hypothetical protein MG293_018374 [Ovis ammon polii]|uniref:Uncharacterized protein n=1 Tax=Ovis ammon polii TaxID=230172 RepID=A0AAD4TUF1_OVIAM|nr:hypothetical protein MG293_018374 [Ovis ammon polii]